MTKWTKTAHKCPDTPRTVIFYLEGRLPSMYFGHCQNIKGFNEFYDENGSQMTEPSHWAELPKEPK